MSDEPHQPAGAPEPELTRRQLRENRETRRKNPILSFLIETAIVLGMAIVISFIIKTFLFRAFYIPSESMQPTLEVDDRIVVNQLAPGLMDLNRGDVVVFEDTRSWWGGGASPDPGPLQQAMIFIGLAPDTSSHYVVKRVVGLGGDTVECCDDDGRILVNGQPVDEPYIYPGDAPSDVEFHVEVPEDHVWLLGDHRGASADSRSHTDETDMGAVPLDDIVGRNMAVVWPLDRLSGGGSDGDPFQDVPDPSELSSATPR